VIAATARVTAQTWPLWPLLALLACAEPTPFSVTIENATEQLVAFDQIYGEPDLHQYVEHRGGLTRVLDPHGGCYRRCDQYGQNICVSQIPREQGAYALLPGDTLTREFSGEGWVESTDAAGDCHRLMALPGPVTIELFFGTLLLDGATLEILEPTASGFVEGAAFDPDQTLLDAVDLPGETQVTMTIRD